MVGNSHGPNMILEGVETEKKREKKSSNLEGIFFPMHLEPQEKHAEVDQS